MATMITDCDCIRLLFVRQGVYSVNILIELRNSKHCYFVVSLRRSLHWQLPSLSALGCCYSWWVLMLHEQPAVWSDDDEYNYCKRFCAEMMVVNNPAERAVKDVQDCAIMTRDQTHRDVIIPARSDHRGRAAPGVQRK